MDTVRCCDSLLEILPICCHTWNIYFDSQTLWWLAWIVTWTLVRVTRESLTEGLSRSDWFMGRLSWCSSFIWEDPVHCGCPHSLVWGLKPYKVVETIGHWECMRSCLSALDCWYYVTSYPSSLPGTVHLDKLLLLQVALSENVISKQQ